MKTHSDHDSTPAAVPISSGLTKPQRSRHRAWIAAAGCCVSVALTGCSGSSDTQDTSAKTPQAAQSAGRSAATAGEPQPGTCWAVPAAVWAPNYWFDDSTQVPCTSPHTTETVTTYSLAEPTIHEAERLAHYCWDDVRVYLGIDEDSWVPWGPAAFLPGKAEVAAGGAGWMRCDAFFPTTTRSSGPRTTNVSAKGIADAPPAEFWACTNKPPAKGDQPFVSCDRPHNYEQTGTLAIVDGITEYPSAAELATEARRQCRDGVPAGYDDVTVDAAWDPRSTYVAGTGLAGWCFMFKPDGRALPAR